MDRVWSDYWDSEGGGLFDTARGRAAEEGLAAGPSQAGAGHAHPFTQRSRGDRLYARLHELTGDSRWKARSEELLRAFAGSARELGLYAATYLLAVDWHLNPATHLVVVGDPNDPAVRAMHEAALGGFIPRRVVQLLVAGRGSQPTSASGVERNDRRRASTAGVCLHWQQLQPTGCRSIGLGGHPRRIPAYCRRVSVAA